nr:hypothetical protein [Tanacetum cinerariifolium]
QPTNKNLKTSSNTKNKNGDNTPRTDKGIRYEKRSGEDENQRDVKVIRDMDKVGNQVVQQSRMQCYNCKDFRHTTRECRSAKRVKDSSYHKDKMLLCKQEEVKVQLTAKQQD